MYTGLHVKHPSFLSHINETFNFQEKSFEKYSNIIFHENPSSGSRLAPCGMSEDTKKLTVAFSNFANAPKN